MCVCTCVRACVRACVTHRNKLLRLLVIVLTTPAGHCADGPESTTGQEGIKSVVGRWDGSWEMRPALHNRHCRERDLGRERSMSIVLKAVFTPPYNLSRI